MRTGDLRWPQVFDLIYKMPPQPIKIDREKFTIYSNRRVTR